MNYQAAIQRLQQNEYKVISGIEVAPSSREAIYLEVEVSPFSIYSNIEKIKRILPEMEVKNGGTNGGTGIIYVKSKP